MKVSGFKGLNNRIDAIRLMPEFQIQANNVLCDVAGMLLRRPGLTTICSGLKDIYGTPSHRLLAINSQDQLIEINAAHEIKVLHTEILGAPFQWAELGYALFLLSSTHQWAIYPHRVCAWGSLCATEVNDADSPGYSPPPSGYLLATRGSQLVVADYDAAKNYSVLYYSRPDYPHEFALYQDYIMIPGKIMLLASFQAGLLVGTNQAVYLDFFEQPLQRVADYGVAEHAGAFSDSGMIYFWTERGLCVAPPFKNLTDNHWSVQNYSTTRLGILEYRGDQYAIIQQTGAKRLDRRSQSSNPLSLT